MKSRKDNGALCVCAQSLSHVWLCVTLWTVAHLASLSMEFSRQEYWSRFPFSLQGIFPTQGSNPRLLHWQADSLPLCHLGSSIETCQTKSKNPKKKEGDEVAFALGAVASLFEVGLWFWWTSWGWRGQKSRPRFHPRSESKWTTTPLRMVLQ